MLRRVSMFPSLGHRFISSEAISGLSRRATGRVRSREDLKMLEGVLKGLSLLDQRPNFHGVGLYEPKSSHYLDVARLLEKAVLDLDDVENIFHTYKRNGIPGPHDPNDIFRISIRAAGIFTKTSTNFTPAKIP